MIRSRPRFAVNVIGGPQLPLVRIRASSCTSVGLLPNRLRTVEPRQLSLGRPSVGGEAPTIPVLGAASQRGGTLVWEVAAKGALDVAQKSGFILIHSLTTVA